jgi:hypothetical protein
MVQVIGSIKHGLEQNLEKMNFYLLNYLGMSTQNETKHGEMQQDELLGDPRMAAQECDCDFSTSGDIVFYPEYIEFYEKTYIKDPYRKKRSRSKFMGLGIT